jgi:hypothetical protein
LGEIFQLNDDLSDHQGLALSCEHKDLTKQVELKLIQARNIIDKLANNSLLLELLIFFNLQKEKSLEQAK